jgi:hypothetical protein
MRAWLRPEYLYILPYKSSPESIRSTIYCKTIFFQYDFSNVQNPLVGFPLELRPIAMIRLGFGMLKIGETSRKTWGRLKPMALSGSASCHDFLCSPGVEFPVAKMHHVLGCAFTSVGSSLWSVLRDRARDDMARAMPSPFERQSINAFSVPYLAGFKIQSNLL